MPKSAGKPGTGKSERIEMRISNQLEEALNHYCEQNLVTVAEAATQAIKQFIGFNSPEQISREIAEDPAEKPKRLEIRTHPKLKEQLREFCQRNNTSISLVVTNAIRMYIKSDE